MAQRRGERVPKLKLNDRRLSMAAYFMLASNGVRWVSGTPPHRAPHQSTISTQSVSQAAAAATAKR